jgi:DNA polymerase-4
LLTLGELRRAGEDRLRPLFGKHWTEWRERAAGIDDREVVPEHDDKSVSHERTFDEDLRAPNIMQVELAALADKVAARLRAKNLRAGCIGIKVRTADFRTLTRQLTLATPTDESRVIAERARHLLEAWLAGSARPRVRLLGVSTSQFHESVQQDLFAEPERLRNEKLDETLDKIRGKFGGAALAPANLLKRRR